MNSRAVLLSIGLPLLAVVAALAAAIAFGGPTVPPPMASINDPFKGVSFAGLPPLSRYPARDGATLAYRDYAAKTNPARGSIVLVHGSSASSNSMHPMASAFAAAGYRAFALDIRGHGESGTKGRIAYIGQLEDDLEDFVKAIKPVQPSTLAGFSAGGGFVIRFAGSARQTAFQSYLLLSPFISQDAATYRPDSGGWVNVGMPRIVALALLNRAGLRWFNDLPVTRFALNEQAKAFLTPEYTLNLAINFRPHLDYVDNLKAIAQPAQLLAGVNDEAFYAERFADVMRAADKAIPVTLIPGVGHIPLTLDANAIARAIEAVATLQGR